ncbi:polyphosphate kinase 2 [Kineococcus aurantiacus]|uniref:ADP/GDP-polyphosphate phosphotransferase n=1 Tax=Kineococcus aurantiacus TaxID=37633 RepID=A0A7Y9ATC0_9ACTN|nr:polyphosphate kinase 2 [Kineococcus aurantiacus]NYD21603.1 polyphosphate kinase 2 [Kineococcus aurantiacus]
MAKRQRDPEDGGVGRVPRAAYEARLLELQRELVVLQDWVVRTGARVAILFEGRDAAGKGGTIKRLTEYLNPRTARTVALPAPTERERGQWYFQRYVQHLPTAGEIVLFDRSWYNRAGVERVMGFCTPEELERFLVQAPEFERMLVDDGILLLKHWFSVSDTEQEKRLRSRLEDPMRRWKLSEMDVEARRRWVDFSRAKDEVFARCDTPWASWWVVEADDKRAARLNCLAHVLDQVPYVELPPRELTLGPRPAAGGYVRPPRESHRYVPDVAAALRR